MRTLQRFILTTLLCLIGVAAYAQAQPSPAGQVMMVSGQVQAQSGQKTRTLQPGAYFYTGDTLVTGKASTIQIRFTDGTVMALYANSKIQVSDYVFAGKSSNNNRSVINLIQGGFRAITGLISKINPGAYQVQTPVAVIGVRGTNFGAIISNQQLYAGVWKGNIYLKNNKGLINLGKGDDYQFALVSSNNDAPMGLVNPPKQLVGQCGF